MIKFECLNKIQFQSLLFPWRLWSTNKTCCHTHNLLLNLLTVFGANVLRFLMLLSCDEATNCQIKSSIENAMVIIRYFYINNLNILKKNILSYAPKINQVGSSRNHEWIAHTATNVHLIWLFENVTTHGLKQLQNK